MRSFPVRYALRAAVCAVGLGALGALAGCETLLVPPTPPVAETEAAPVDPRTPLAAPTERLAASNLSAPPGARSRPPAPPPPFRGDASAPTPVMPRVPPSWEAILFVAPPVLEPVT